MKRLRVSDIEALLGPEAAARLVEGVKDNRGKRVYEVEVSLIYTFTDRANAKSEKEARKYLEGTTRDRFRVVDRFADAGTDYGWTEVRSRKAPIVEDEEYPLGGSIVLDDTPAWAEDTNKPKAKAKGPGSTPRPKRPRD